jgi:hypothetical protein
LRFDGITIGGVGETRHFGW